VHVSSAHIGAEFGDPGGLLGKKLAHAFAREGAMRAVCCCALAVVVAGACAFASAAKTVQDHARCDVERERAGFGRTAAMRALNDPDAQSAFTYHVSKDPLGYRVHVAAVAGVAGDYAGEAWERDPLGRMRHVSDTCVPD
jgi:hypothetical protein